MLSWPKLIAWIWSHKHLAADVVLGAVVVMCIAVRRQPREVFFGATIPEVVLIAALVAHHFADAVSKAWAFLFPAEGK